MSDRRTLSLAVIDTESREFAIALNDDCVPSVVVDSHVYIQRLPIISQIEQ